MNRIHIGISGWRYAGWRNVFYPNKLTQSRELEYASRAVHTIEINGSFYSLQSPRRYASWYEESPPGFVFSVKAARYMTHTLRFREAGATRAAMGNFFASGIFNLREKLGPILWQFPPTFKFDEDNFERILDLLPTTTDEAAVIAAQHDARVKEPCLTPDRRRKLRHAIEIRHESFVDPAFIRLLRKYHAALVLSDSVAGWPYAEDLTSDFVYMRLHGTQTVYGGKYEDAALDRWAARIRKWAAGREPEDAQRILDKPARRRAARDVFCYFDNDKKVQAPFDARRLMNRLHLESREARKLV